MGDKFELHKYHICVCGKPRQPDTLESSQHARIKRRRCPWPLSSLHCLNSRTQENNRFPMTVESLMTEFKLPHLRCPWPHLFSMIDS
jgi:hypothetical protein